MKVSCLNRELIRSFSQASEKLSPNLNVAVDTSMNGITVVTVQPVKTTVSKVAAVFNAGSRFENYDTKGMNHILRRSFGMSSSELTPISIIRNFQQMGAYARCIGTRETLTYSIDFAKNLTDKVLELLSNATTRQNLYNWELNDFVKPMLDVDLQHLHRCDFDMLCSEMLHEAAYGDGLGNSLFVEPSRVGDFNLDHMTSFIDRTFTASKTMLIGVSVDHDVLLRMAEYFDVKPLVDSHVKPQTFRGGQLRRDIPLGCALVSVAWPCAGLNDPKKVLAASVLAHSLDGGSLDQRVLWAADRGALPATDQCSGAASLLTAYSDCGLLGFTVTGARNAVGDSVRLLNDRFEAAASGGISAQQFQQAQNLVVAKLLMSIESRDNLVDHLVSQACCTTQLTSIEETISAVSALSHEETNKVAQEVFSGKKAMAALGELANVPFLDEL